MKKTVLAISVSLGLTSAVFAQPDRSDNNRFDNKNSRYEVPKQSDNRRDDRFDKNTDFKKYDNNGNFDRNDNRRISDRDRRVEIDRINKDYDRRIVVYRNDRNMNTRDRDYRIQQLEKERNDKVKAFGGGLILGGILGILLGK